MCCRNAEKRSCSLGPLSVLEMGVSELIKKVRIDNIRTNICTVVCACVYFIRESVSSGSAWDG